MNKNSTVLILVVALLPGCASTNEGAKECTDFLAGLQTDSKPFPRVFDLEKEYAIHGENLTQRYESIPSLQSGCQPGSISPDLPQDIMSPWPNAPRYVEAQAGIASGVPWIQFIYPRTGDDGSGLESSIVFYDGRGAPISTKLAASYLSWENSTNVRSVFNDGAINYCKESIEFSSYNDNGDLASPLSTPIRSPCEASTNTYP